jgi:hypothetical protein
VRIAIVEWFPRICGVTDWGIHLGQANVPGTTVHRVTFSKSGRRLAAWGTKGAEWVPYKLADAPEVLSSYDLVILDDIICQAPEVDGKAKKAGVLPYYVDVMSKVRAPFTAMIHDGAYPNKDATVQALLALPNFSGVLMATRAAAPGRVAEMAPEAKVRWARWPYLPYDPALIARGPEVRTKAAIMSSRFSTTKGQDTALWLLPKFKELEAIHLWGFNSYGKPSLAWRLYEMAMAMGYETTHFPEKGKVGRHPLMYKFYTAAFAVRMGAKELVYHNKYAALADVDWSPWLGLSLTNERLTGTLEYNILDNIARGCVAVVPAHQLSEVDPGYAQLFPSIPYRRASFKYDLDAKVVEPRKVDWDEAGIVATVDDLLTSDDATLQDLARQQRGALREWHEPARVLARLLEVLG